MKNNILNRIILTLSLLFTMTLAHGQILDGTIQSARFRVSLPLTFNFDDGSINSSPYISYKHDISSWMKGAVFAQYNVKQEAFISQAWFEFSAAKKYYLLSRSIYNFYTEKYSHGLAATIKLPSHLSVDATWDNMFEQAGGEKLDRFQVVGGYINKRFIANAGYSMLRNKGLVANLRIMFCPTYFLQMKYDGGQNVFVLTNYINM